MPRPYTHKSARERQSERPTGERERQGETERDKERQSESRRVDSGVQSSGFGV